MEIRIYSEELRGPAAPGKEKQAQIKHLQKELLRKALRDTGIYFAEQEELPQVLHTAYGKPYFPFLPDFHYNFSDSGRFVVLAASRKGPVCRPSPALRIKSECFSGCGPSRKLI